MGADLSLTATGTGLVLSSFFLGYALMQMPGGLLADKFGAKRILLIAVIVWSVFTGLTAVAWSLGALIVVRFLFGIGEGGFQPSASKIISTSFPENERSRTMSIMISSGAIMALLVPIISAYLLETIGWQAIFVIAGLLGVFIAFLYWKFIPNQEVEVSEEQAEQNKGILKKLLTMPLMWGLLISYFTIYAVNWDLTSWMPKYLTDVRNLDLMSIGYLQMIPGLMMLIAILTFGVIIDKLSLNVNKLIAAACAAGVAIFIFLMSMAESIGMFIFYQSCVTILMSYVTLVLPSFVLKIIPSQIAGTAMGMANTGGQLAGFATPTIMGMMVDAMDGSYNYAFWLLVVFAIICIISVMSLSVKNKGTDAVSGHEVSSNV